MGFYQHGFSKEVALALLSRMKVSELRVELSRRQLDKGKVKGELIDALRKQMEREYDEWEVEKEKWQKEQEEGEKEEEIVHRQMMDRLRRLRDSSSSDEEVQANST